MKKTTYLILRASVALALVVLFFIFIKLHQPLFILLPLAAVLVLYLIFRKRLISGYQDEREAMINAKCASATFRVGAVVFTLANLALAVYAFGVPHMLMPHGPFPQPPVMQPDLVGLIAFGEIIILLCMCFVHFGFRVYYEHKYGEYVE